jgi:hypothetical protein
MSGGFGLVTGFGGAAGLGGVKAALKRAASAAGETSIVRQKSSVYPPPISSVPLCVPCV